MFPDVSNLLVLHRISRRHFVKVSSALAAAPLVGVRFA
ncbi:twin-arginine translocation signal domain-containing protein, partial [Serratia sp. PL7]